MDTNKLIALMPELAVFKIVVDEGSFTAAAKKLGVTPSALSKQLSRLNTRYRPNSSKEQLVNSLSPSRVKGSMINAVR